jgi:hypothetical protein
MSAPRTKRPFAGDASQRHITTFFSSRGQGAAHHDHEAVSPTAAALPASVQSNLLSVGMRVRKSVPEGYKTGSAYGSFNLWSDQQTTSLSSAQQQPAYPSSYPPRAASACDFPIQPPITSIHPGAGTAVVSSRRELLPFCGLHRVGGLAAQPGFEGEETVVFADDVFGGEPVPGLTNSQDSIASTATLGPASTNRKRSHANLAEMASRPIAWGHGGVTFLDGEVSPRTATAPEPYQSGAGGRVLAVPRRRKVVGGGGQENVLVVSARERSGGDFDEAEFLVWEEEGRQFDMEMAGV